MKIIHTALLSTCLMFAAGASLAQDAMKKASPPTDPMTKYDMSAQECKDHMAMMKKDGMKKDSAMMKKEATCNDMMKKDKMMKDGAASAPMK